jgi:hypothetical protein
MTTTTVTTKGVHLVVLLMLAAPAYSQTPAPTPVSTPEMPMARTDFFAMFGSDFNRPGLLPRANYFPAQNSGRNLFVLR